MNFTELEGESDHVW